MTRILIVDDEFHILAILQEMLEQRGYACRTASNASEAKDRLAEEAFELMLCDIRMPEESGLDLLRFVHEAYPDTAVLMISGMDDPDVAREATDCGAFGYLLKPFQANRVYINVENALRRRELELEGQRRQEDLERQVEERTKELSFSESRLRYILDSVAAGIILVDAESFTIVEVNPAAEEMIGASEEDLVGKVCHETLCPSFSDGCLQDSQEERFENSEQMLQQADGQLLPVLKTVVPIDLGGRKHYLESFTDISERKAMEKRIIQSEKMESMGQLAAGIAHEINTPAQYIGDNTRFVEEGTQDLFELIEAYEALLQAAKEEKAFSELTERIDSSKEEYDLEFLEEEIPVAMQQTLEGVDRISKLVVSVKQYAHPSTEEMASADLNDIIDKTVTLSRNEWKYVAEVRTELDPDLPLIPCKPGEIGQVVLNLLINAAHAIGSKVDPESEAKGDITIRSGQDNGRAWIEVADSGTGIPENVQDKIFDLFFTTKEMGKGTGQGLAIVRKVVEENHHGSLSFQTVSGEGTTFRVSLPLVEGEAAAPAASAAVAK